VANIIYPNQGKMRVSLALSKHKLALIFIYCYVINNNKHQRDLR